jgi:hypothetical protein
MRNLNINSFWKKLKNKLQKKTKVQIDIDLLKEVFYKKFNEKLISSNNESEEALDEEFIVRTESTVNDKYKMSESVLLDIIKELKTNKSIGRLVLGYLMKC